MWDFLYEDMWLLVCLFVGHHWAVIEESCVDRELYIKICMRCRLEKLASISD